jgi:hypothetical protein
MRGPKVWVFLKDFPLKSLQVKDYSITEVKTNETLNRAINTTRGFHSSARLMGLSA